MSQADFDPELQWDDLDELSAPPEETEELLPPDLLHAEIEPVEDAQDDLTDPYPGIESGPKSTDPDEWHH